MLLAAQKASPTRFIDWVDMGEAWILVLGNAVEPII